MSVEAIQFPLNARRLGAATEFSTHVIENYLGVEVRNQNRADSRRRFNASLGVKALADIQTLITFFNAMRGRAQAFLVKDWLDFEATQAVTTLASGITQQGTSAAYNGSTTVFQLQKTYTAGSQTHNRRITRPVDPVSIYVSGVLQSDGFTVNYTNGRVTFDEAPAAAPTWTGEFSVPCRFEEDQLPSDLILYRTSNKTGFGELPEVYLIEVL